MKRTGFRRRTYQGQPVTPLDALRARSDVRVTVGATQAPPQPKEGDLSDPEYKRWIIATVTICQAPGCGKPATDPSHHRRKGHGRMGGQKEDRRLIMLCHGCHFGEGKDGFHSRYTFPGLTPEQTREHIERMIFENRLAYGGGE